LVSKTNCFFIRVTHDINCIKKCFILTLFYFNIAVRFVCVVTGGFSTVGARQGTNAFIRRCSARCGFIPADSPVFDELCRLADETLYRSITSNPSHVGLLYRLLPTQSTASHNYYLWRRNHNLQIPARVNYLNDCNTITRILYSNSY